MKRLDLLPTTFEGALSKFVEEVSEALRCVAKIQMHGRVAVDPKTNIRYDNVADLFGELTDVERAAEEIYRLYYEQPPDKVT